MAALSVVWMAASTAQPSGNCWVAYSDCSLAATTAAQMDLYSVAATAECLVQKWAASKDENWAAWKVESSAAHWVASKVEN